MTAQCRRTPPRERVLDAEVDSDQRFVAPASEVILHSVMARCCKTGIDYGSGFEMGGGILEGIGGSG